MSTKVTDNIAEAYYCLQNGGKSTYNNETKEYTLEQTRGKDERKDKQKKH